MKRLFAALLALLVAAAALAGCAKAPTPAGEAGDKLKVVATIFPQYDFIRQIAGEQVELTMLLPPGSESHSFEPTPQDIIKIQNCDMFVYVGGDSDSWIDGILASMDTSGKTIVSLMNLVDVVEEEIVEGMEDDHGHDHDHEEFTPEDVQPRPLTEWAGGWSSLHTSMNDPSFAPYYEAKAEDLGKSAEETKQVYATRWNSEYDQIRIDGSKVTFVKGGVEHTAEYQPTGFEVVETDSGSYSVWYHYETVSTGVPKRILFSDHGYKPSEEHEEEHEDEKDHDHEEEHEHLAHYHLKYGDASVAELIARDWAPTFFPAESSAAQQAESMIDHLSGHSHEDEEEEHGHEDEHEHELDEHVWTSPLNAQRITQALSDTLCQLDAANADSYRQNTAAYLEKLQQLDAAFKEVVAAGAAKALVFGDRFPFRYFTDHYGLDYYAAFPGCSTETEASASTVAFLIDKIKQENIPAVFHLELSNQRMADAIAEATGAKKLLLHSCHNLTRQELEAGIGYLELMNQNVTALKEALG